MPRYHNFFTSGSDWPDAATRLMTHRFESCRLRQCNDWSLIHLVTNCARAYMAIYMHVCVPIYKKGVDYLCSYITHLKEVHLRYNHIITYACLQALVSNALTWQSSCVIANNTRKTKAIP